MHDPLTIYDKLIQLQHIIMASTRSLEIVFGDKKWQQKLIIEGEASFLK